MGSTTTRTTLTRESARARRAGTGESNRLSPAQRRRNWANIAQLRVTLEQGWRGLYLFGRGELIRDDPAKFLRVFLRVARDPETALAVRLEAYRLLIFALEGELADHELARVLHREWIGLGLRIGALVGPRPPAARPV